jgi:hypothetical protein
MNQAAASSSRARRPALIDALAVFGGLLLLVGTGLYIRHLTGLDGLLEAHGRNTVGRDFINIWTAGHLALRGDVATLGDLQAYPAFQRALFDAPKLDFHMWSYPPHLLPFTIPFALLPYPLALAVWNLGGIAAFLAAAVGGLPRAEQWRGALVLAPVIAVNVIAGQNGLFTAALAVGAWRSLDRAPILAGLLLALLTVKPQLGPMIALMLLIERRWLTIGVALAATAALVGLSALWFGIEAWRQWLTVILPFQSSLAVIDGGVSLHHLMMPTVFVTARLLDVPGPWASGLHAASVIVALGLLAWAVRRGDARRRWIVALIAAACLSPYLFIYDLGAVAIALWFALKDRPTLGRPLGALIGLGVWLPIVAIVTPGLTRGLDVAGVADLPTVQPGALILLAILAWAAMSRDRTGEAVSGR